MAKPDWADRVAGLRRYLGLLRYSSLNSSGSRRLPSHNGRMDTGNRPVTTIYSWVTWRTRQTAYGFGNARVWMLIG